MEGFVLEEMLGRGGLGQVWLATHTATETRVAVKAILAEYAQTPRYLGAFRREARAIARLDHANVAGVFDYGLLDASDEAATGGELTDRSPYLVMEFAEGGSVDVTNLSSWSTVRQILEGLLRGLAHAHAHGVIHRDVKPGNILVAPTPDGHCYKLTDFGIAYAAYDSPGTDEVGSSSGTPHLMSPEQFRGEWRSFGPWTDLYAVGCVTWMLLCGRPPFQGNYMQLAAQHMTAPLPPLQPRFDVPTGVDGWLRSLAAKGVSQRPARCADALEMLKHLDDVVLSAAPAALQPDEMFADTLDSPPPSSPILSGMTPAATGAVRVFPRPPLVQPSFDDQPERTMLPSIGVGLFGHRGVRLVGRQSEVTELWQSFADASTSEEARIVFLRGEAGAGKSRLAEWFTLQLDEAGLAIQMLARADEQAPRHHELGRSAARWLHVDGLAAERVDERIRQAFERYGGIGTHEAEVLADWVEETVSRVPYAKDADRRQVFLHALATVAAHRPVALMIDDAQHADGIFRFLEELSRVDAPVFCVATIRDESADAEFMGQYEAFRRHISCGELTLGALGEREVSSLISEMLGLEPEVAQQVVERAEGNPLFAVEMVSDMLSRGVLEPDDRGFQLAEGAVVPVSDSLHDILSKRLESVWTLADSDAETIRSLLAIGAVLGGRWRDDDWRSLASNIGMQWPEERMQLVARSSVVRQIDREWEFRHGLLAEVLLEELGPARRAEIHSIVADYLSTDGIPYEDLHRNETVGRHLASAGRAVEALEYLAAAADRRNELGDFPAAAGLWSVWFDAAAEAELADEDVRRVRALLGSAWALGSRGRQDEAMEQLAAASELADVSDDLLLKADVAATKAVGLRAAGLFKPAFEQAQRSVEFCRSVEPVDSRRLSKMLRVLGTLQRRFDVAQSVQTLREALDHAEAVGDSYLVAECEWRLSGALQTAGAQREVCRELLDDAFQRYGRLGAREGLFIVWAERGEQALFERRWVEAEAHFEKALDIARKLDQFSVSRLEIAIVATMLCAGDLARAQTHRAELQRVRDGDSGPLAAALAGVCEIAFVSVFDEDVEAAIARERDALSGAREVAGELIAVFERAGVFSADVATAVRHST